MKYSQDLATRNTKKKKKKKKLAPHTKNIFVGRGEYIPCTMENNDANTDYHKFVRLGDQRWEIVEITIGIIFFFFFFVLKICIQYFLYREFSSPTWKKSLPPKVPIPTQNPNLT